MGVDAFDPVAPSPAPANVGGYLATATNAITARTLSNHFGDILNAKDFGAVCNGTTDDTAAMQALIADLGSTAVTVIVSGPTKVTSNITIPATAPVRFEGNGSFTGSGVVTYTAWTQANLAPLASPALTGTPTAPTAAVDTNTTQIATTAYVLGEGYLKSSTAASTYAPIASPTFTGTATTPKLVTSAASGNDAIEIVAGSKISLDGANATQTLRFNDGTAASIPDAQAWQAINPIYQNSWADYGAPYATAAYYRDAAGVVHLRGCMKSGTLTATAFMLPAGYRPAATLSFSVQSNSAFARLDVGSAGTVVPQTGSNVTFFLDGVSFRAEQ